MGTENASRSSVTRALAAVIATWITADGAAADAGGKPLAAALARHGTAEVAALRAQPGDAARCTLGAVYARRGDLPRADLYLAGCDAAALPDEIAADVARAIREVRRALDASELASVAIDTIPAGLAVEIEGLPGERFAAPRTVWVRAGHHELRAAHADATFTTSVDVAARTRASALIDTRPRKPRAQGAPRPQQLDFRDDHDAQTQQAGPPPAVKHGSLVKGKWAGEVTPVVADHELEDPLALRRGPRPPRATWLGLRAGAGVFDDGRAGARAGLALALSGRRTLGGAVFLAGRLDWSHRGGEIAADGAMDAAAPGDAISALGLGAGAGVTLLDHRALTLAAIGQLRADLRLASSRALAEVPRFGLGVAAGLEVTLPASPISAGLRLEQGATALAGDARDRAVLLELGVDWR